MGWSSKELSHYYLSPGLLCFYFNIVSSFKFFKYKKYFFIYSGPPEGVVFLFYQSVSESKVENNNISDSPDLAVFEVLRFHEDCVNYVWSYY